MTTRELRNEVSALCAIDIGEKDRRFISYANLALRTLYNELSFSGEKRIRLGNRPLTYTDKILHTGKDSVIIPLEGVSYSMTVSGRGSIRISDSIGTRSRSFDTEETAVRGFLSGCGTLTVAGDITIRHLATFSEDFGNVESDIRILTPVYSYSMRKVTPDFHSFLTFPTYSDGKPATGVKIVDDKLIVPKDLFGDLTVIYRRLPGRILIDIQDTGIDLPDEYTELLILLCAYFMLMEDEPQPAEKFKEHYTKLLEERKTKYYERIGDGYIDTNGWA